MNCTPCMLSPHLKCINICFIISAILERQYLRGKSEHMPLRVAPDKAPLTADDWQQAARSLSNPSRQELLMKMVCFSGLKDSDSRRLAWPVLLGCWGLDEAACRQMASQELYMQLHATIQNENHVDEQYLKNVCGIICMACIFQIFTPNTFPLLDLHHKSRELLRIGKQQFVE